MYGCVILAGGYGKRLRPVTNGLPKPLVSVGTKPVLSHILHSLSKIGVEKCALTLMYEGEQIKKYYGREFEGIRLEYFTESEPLGTAGGVKRAASALDCDNVIVLSGDGMFDFDINELVVFHNVKKADVTVGTYYSNNPTEYGTVLCDKDGKIEKFSEKAPWSRTVTGNINTGIYVIRSEILDMIPDGEAYDFAKDLFPRMQRENKSMYAKRLDGYWCDIGNLKALYEANTDALNMRIKAEFPPLDEYGCIVGENAEISPSSNRRNSVIGNGCSIGENSSIVNCVLFDGVSVGDNCILDGVMVKQNIKVADGTRENDKIISENTCKKFSKEDEISFTDEGIVFDIEDKENFVKFGFCIAQTAGGKIGFSCDDGEKSEKAKTQMIDGACKYEYGVFDFGTSWQAQAAFAAYSFALSASVFVCEKGDKIIVRIFDSSTLPVCNDFERSLENSLKNTVPYTAKIINPKQTGIYPRYTDALLKSVYGGDMGVFSLSDIKISLNDCKAKGCLMSALALLDAEVYTKQKAIEYFGQEENGIIYADISDDGFELKIVSGGATYRTSQICAILAADAAQRGEYELPTSYERAPEIEWADDRIKIEKYSHAPQDKNEALARYDARRKLWINDASFMLMRLAAVIKSRNMSLAKLSALGRQVWRRETVIKCNGTKTYIMDCLLSDGASGGGEGVVYSTNGGRANVICNRNDSLRIIGYASSSEAAAEICSDMKRRIEEYSEKKKQK